MLTGIHILLTYKCTSECDHCFLYSSPQAEGTFTLEQLGRVFAEIARIESIDTVYFEGGEPFLFYPLMLEGMRMAARRKLKIGVVSNCYWSTSVDDAVLWLRPLTEFDIDDLSLSDDLFHHDEAESNPAKLALAAAVKLGLPTGTIAIDPVTVKNDAERKKGEPVVGGGVLFRGRAVEKLTEGVPKRAWKELTTCPYEELQNPERVHVDSFGNLHLCQGLSMGNMWQTGLPQLAKSYRAENHPICAPLVKGGPALLAQQYGVAIDESYIDECHMCYLVRKALVDRFPEYLAPRQVYGL